MMVLVFLVRSVDSMASSSRSHTKFSRPSDARWVEVDDLEGGEGAQFQFWVTAVNSAGEGMSSNVVTQAIHGAGISVTQLRIIIVINGFL